VTPGRAKQLASVALRLCKVKISLLAASSGAAGFILSAPRLTARLFLPVAGILILACGACALNQVQEGDLDARMMRTMNRPILRREIRPRAALGMALVVLGLGFALLAARGPAAAFLGALAVVWYNGVYTALKRISPFAAVPGALTGAVPPAIGWLSAGGSLNDTRLAMLCLLLFIWQVPHFWLVLLRRGPEYERARLPVLTRLLSGHQIRRIIALWVLGAAAGALVISLSALAGCNAARAVILVLAAWLSYEAVRFRLKPGRSEAKLFKMLNVFLAASLLTLCLGRLASLERHPPFPARTAVAHPVSRAADSWSHRRIVSSGRSSGRQ
jgi:protoheme IX farnesyltransferase